MVIGKPLYLSDPRGILYQRKEMQAVNRALSLDRSFRNNPIKKEQVFVFMDKIFQKGHAEEAPPIPDTKQRWYLPMFGVYHPQKKGLNTLGVWFLSEWYVIQWSSTQRSRHHQQLAGHFVTIPSWKSSSDRRCWTNVSQLQSESWSSGLPMISLGPWERPKSTLKGVQNHGTCFGNRPSPAVATYGLRRSVALTLTSLHLWPKTFMLSWVVQVKMLLLTWWKELS